MSKILKVLKIIIALIEILNIGSVSYSDQNLKNLIREINRVHGLLNETPKRLKFVVFPNIVISSFKLQKSH